MSVWLFRAAYLLGGAWLLVWETIALLNSQRKDTISEQVWQILDHPFSGPLWYLTAAIILWVLFHFLFQGRLG